MEQRSGIATQVMIIPEADGWDKDPAAVVRYVVPISDKAGYKDSQAIEAAPVYVGDVLPPGVVDMNREAQGPLPIALEFVFLGRILKILFGTNGYLQPRGATGKLHQFYIPTVVGSKPGSMQVIRKFLEATAQLLRTSGNKIQSIDWGYATAGRAIYTVNLIGSGKVSKVDLGGGTTVDVDYEPASYFNQIMKLNGKTLVGLTNFTDQLNTKAARTEVGANAGHAGSIVTSFYDASGSLETIMGDDDASNAEANFYLYDLAEADTEFEIECIYSDLPPDICTQFFRKRYWVRLSKSSAEPGGDAGLIQSPTWQLIRSKNAKIAPELIGDNLGTFNIPAAAKLGVKVDGAAAIEVNITQGAARTVDQVVADLQGHAPLTALCDVDKFMGRVRITHKTKGAAKTLQIDTAVVGSCHALLGFDNVVISGKDKCPLLYEIFNQLGAAY